MKILWLVNIVMPELAVHLGRKPSVFGGWLSGAMAAVKGSGHELVVCTTEEHTSAAGRYQLDGVTYYVSDRTDVETMRHDFQAILEDEKPDVVHIYGTEFAHCWAMAQAANPRKTLVTIQGSLHYIKAAAYAGIPERICRDNWLHKLLRRLHKGGTSIDLQRISFAQRAELECRTLRHVKYINGGSAWGNAVARSINPDCKTLDCNLILRRSFYDAPLWQYDACTPHTIYALFTYPVKGFHKLLEAMPMILHRFPDAKIRVVGNRLAERRYGRLKTAMMDYAQDYQWYVQGLIDRLGLKDHIEYLGYLDEQQVQQQLRWANVFVSPSSIENQSTAMGEAMMLGVPCVASCVGAMQEMIDHGRDGFLYPFDAPYLLADHICRIFENRELAEQFSVRGRSHAQKTYNREENCRKLLEMYETVAANR